MKELIKCTHCGKEYCKNGIGTHIWKNHTEEGIKHNPNIGLLFNRQIWNKGLTKETSESVRKSGETYTKRIKSGEIKGSMVGRKHSQEVKDKISKKMSLNNKGGRCKWYDYLKNDGTLIHVQGSWELRFCKVLEFIDKDFIKVTSSLLKEPLTWIDLNNKSHCYTPDFYCPNIDKFFEIKGFWWGNDKFKMEQIFKNYPNLNIELVKEKELIEYENFYNVSTDLNNILKHKIVIKKTKVKILRDEIFENWKNQIIKSKIDFTKHGWVTKICKELGINSKKFNNFINIYFQDFYNLKNICKEDINQNGTKNSQYGTCWINNTIENKKIKKQDFINYPNWILGKIKKC